MSDVKKPKLIPIAQVADKLGLHKSSVLKYCRKVGIMFHQIRLPESKNILTFAITPEQLEQVEKMREREGYTETGCPDATTVGVFYMTRPIPELDPNRIKMGFTTNIASRMKAHRAASPNLEVICKFPSRKEWEQCAIDSITRVDCEQVGTEVYRFNDVDAAVKRAEEFFKMLPFA